MAVAGAFRWDDDLTGAAKQIAGLDHTPIRVLAGPGTGKTFVLMRRVARLLQQRTDPKRILICTFTRTAARDLEKELLALGVPGADGVRAGTLHAFCFALLSQAEVLELTNRVPRPLLNFEERFMLQDLDADGVGGIRDRQARLKAFNAAWARLQTDEPGWPSDSVDQAFHACLTQWLRFHDAMLIGELVPETLRYLRENPACPERTAFAHVLVDEYQDLNRAEQVLLDLLSEGGMLTVVGDEDQSIYSFKHAHPDGIADFDQIHNGTHDENLDECRRCPCLVVEMANALIFNNQTRTNRNLTPMTCNPAGEVLVVQWPRMDDEAEGIAELIRQRVQRGEVAPGRILVLAPRRQFGYAIRDALNSIGVLAHSFFYEEALDGAPKRLDDSAAQQAFTLLTLLAEREDRVALRCWCGFGSTSLRAGAWRRLRKHCEQSGDSPWAALEQMSSGELTLAHTGDLVSRFQDIQTRLAALEQARGQDLLDALFPTTNDWAKPYRSLAARIEGDDYKAADLREHLRVGITQPELPTDVDYVRVMSLHKSKGLTADMVVIVGCVEGLVPTAKRDLSPVEQDRLLEEQRRLFYVAITRTRKILVLSSVVSLPRDLAWRMGAQVHGGTASYARAQASRFLTELGTSRPRTVLGSSVLGGRI